MLSQNLKFLWVHLAGIAIALFLSITIGFVDLFSPALLGTIKAAGYLALLYTEAWHLGKKHAALHICSLKELLLSTQILWIPELILAVLVPFLGTTAGVGIAVRVWLLAFVNFYGETLHVLAVPATLAATAVTAATGYLVGTKGFSALNSYEARKQKRFEEKREKHNREIEDIKNRYKSQ